ncbi:hypothetical protein LCGC14_1814320 [marine sediment metagenome]|uniref:Uncharacterized protein n=1 Tax=marine sediment metagenome TaxID=412755 RepID=A0A0F9GKN8_9ZZZZ
MTLRELKQKIDIIEKIRPESLDSKLYICVYKDGWGKKFIKLNNITYPSIKTTSDFADLEKSTNLFLIEN